MKTRYVDIDRPRPLRSVRVPKAPIEVTDAMVRSLIRYDAARRAVVKKRVDQWIEDHHVVTEEDLKASGKDPRYATRVRVDLNRTKFGSELQQKGTTFLTIWSERHYALVSREGTNTFRISHKHQEDFPDVWPMYRMRVVADPSAVSQPAFDEKKVDREGKTVYAPSYDVKVIAALEAKEKKDEEVARSAEDASYDAMRGQSYDEKAREKISDLTKPGKEKKSHKKKILPKSLDPDAREEKHSALRFPSRASRANKPDRLGFPS